MNNYQLYRSIVHLGGEVKLNLVINEHDSELCITDYHITPVSNNIPYNRFLNENLLNYSHQENIKSFYKKIQSNFFNPGVSAKYLTPWPLMDYHVYDYINPWHMGCKRASYKLYHKQFEFFCPLWIERIAKDESIYFKFDVYEVSDKKDTPLSSKILKLQNNHNTTHNKFVTYLENYFNDFYMTDKSTGSELMYISLENHEAWVTGIDLKSGNYRKINISNIIDTIMDRERPLLEFDSLLCGQFKNNNIIAKQLLNFNLCFNISDISSPYVVQHMMGKPINIVVTAGVIRSDKYIPFEQKDFYTNHVYIPKKQFMQHNINDIINNVPQKQDDIKINVLSYLSEPDNIGLYVKNKMSQHIHTWSLLGNNEYIFNVYDGFSSYIKKS